MLSRLWTGIVGAVAGVAVGIVIAIVLKQNGWPLERILNAVWASGGIGFVLGLLLGGRKTPPQEE